jgi:uncharacterized damage-inducible protein DinB
MTNRQIVEQFEKTWFYNRKVTMDYLDAIPEHKWNYTHHPKYASLSKQFRHVTCVYGVYIEGFKNQAVDFSRKHSHYSGPLTKDSIRADLLNKDEELKSVLAKMKDSEVETFELDFFGVRMSFTEYTHILIQHECMHIGIWSTMAAFGDFELPQSWKNDWGF